MRCSIKRNHSKYHLFFQVHKSFLHHGTVSGLKKQRTEFIPGLPSQVKIHVPLQGKRISRLLTIQLPATDNRLPSFLLQLHNKCGICLLNQLFLEILKPSCRSRVTVGRVPCRVVFQQGKYTGPVVWQVGGS